MPNRLITTRRSAITSPTATTATPRSHACAPRSPRWWWKASRPTSCCTATFSMTSPSSAAAPTFITSKRNSRPAAREEADAPLAHHRPAAMPWKQIIIESREAAAERISAALEQAGAVAVTLQDAADQPVFQLEPGEPPLWPRTEVCGLFDGTADPAQLIAELNAHLANAAPLQISVSTPPDPAAVNILLDPGLAFGTGTHPTTALCLEWLDGEELYDKTVIDFGCGSGILAIAAARLGARTVWAVDRGPQALLATGDNAAANDVASQIQRCTADELPALQADIVLANILAGPLIALAAHFAALI